MNLEEFASLAKRGVANLPNVIDGNLNRFRNSLGILPEELKQEAERRYLICSACPFNSINAKETGFYVTTIEYEHCSVCKCPTQSKVTAFEDNCGLVLLKDLQGYKPLWTEYKPKDNNG